jgi:hypothetical protein
MPPFVRRSPIARGVRLIFEADDAFDSILPPPTFSAKTKTFSRAKGKNGPFCMCVCGHHVRLPTMGPTGCRSETPQGDPEERGGAGHRSGTSSPRTTSHPRPRDVATGNQQDARVQHPESSRETEHPPPPRPTNRSTFFPMRVARKKSPAASPGGWFWWLSF